VLVESGLPIPEGEDKKIEAEEDNGTGTMIAVATVGALAVGVIAYAVTKLLKKA
jgi:hypothetical protein